MLNLSDRVPTAQIEARLGRPMTKAESDRYEAYLADMARYHAGIAQEESDRAARLFTWLGDRPAAVASVEKNNSLFELTVEIIGRTAEAAEQCAAAYVREHDGKLPRFFGVHPWHGGFRITGSRRESI